MTFSCPAHVSVIDLQSSGLLEFSKEDSGDPGCDSSESKLAAIILPDRFHVNFDHLPESLFQHWGNHSNWLGLMGSVANPESWDSVCAPDGVHVESATIAMMPLALHSVSYHGYGSGCRFVHVNGEK